MGWVTRRGQSTGTTRIPEIIFTRGNSTSRLNRGPGACPNRISIFPHFEFKFGVLAVCFGFHVRVKHILHFIFGEDPPAGKTAVID